MRIRTKGTLTKWNAKRGFGFIAPDDSGPEVFVHISAFPKDGPQPKIGECIFYEVETNGSGKTRASNLICPDRQPATGKLTIESDFPKAKSWFLRPQYVLLVVIALLAYGYERHSPRPSVDADEAVGEVDANYERRSQPTTVDAQSRQDVPNSEQLIEQSSSAITKNSPQTLPENFACDGRTSCPQMKSCAEATYFLNNCPNVKMDGDFDGIPCEDHWCAHGAH